MKGELKYSKDHIWLQWTGTNRVRIGISFYAAQKIGEIVHVELPEVGDLARSGQSIGTAESAKTVTDLYCPLNGTVLEINQRLKDHPMTLHDDPLDSGWIAIIEIADPKDGEHLLSSAQYIEWMEELL